MSFTMGSSYFHRWTDIKDILFLQYLVSLQHLSWALYSVAGIMSKTVSLNPLSSKIDKHLISPYNITS